jgi:hypothetical protein
VGDQGTLTLSKNVTIDGTGASITVEGGSTQGSPSNAQPFVINSGVTAVLNDLTVSNGYTPVFGGGIENGGTLTVSNCTLSGNSAVEGGGIFNFGTLTVSNCTLSDNSASGAGGGISNLNEGGRLLTVSNCTLSGNSAKFGGGIFNGPHSTLTVSNCTLSGNSADEGGGIDNNSSLTISGGTLTLTNCTLSGNSARGYNGGGGIFNDDFCTLTVSNCTLSGNSAGLGGGGGIANYPHGTLTVSNCTLSGNSGRGVGGIFNAETLTLNNTIVAHSTTGGNTGGDIGNIGSIIGSHNLIQDGSGGLRDTLTGDPLLSGTLANNGGPTQTLALLPGSPAIGHGGPLDTSAQPVAAGTATVTLSPPDDLAVGEPLLPVGQQLLIDPGQPHQEVVTVTAATAATFTATFAQAHAAGFAVALATDQRGVSRPAAAPDIGAFQDRGFTLQANTIGQEAFTGNPFNSPLVARVVSAYGDPVAGGVGVITFTSPAGGASTAALSTPVTIAADGTATAAVTANGTAGHYQVTATAAAAGVSGSVSFALTNVAVTFGTQTLTYNGSPQSISATVTSSDATYTVGYSQGTGGFTGQPTNAGNYAIVVTLPDGEQMSQTFAIGKADLYVTATANSKKYGQAASDTGTLTGVAAGDGITASFSSAGDAAAAPVGTGVYTISATLSDPNNKLANYTVHQTTATLTVSTADLYVTAAANSKKYGQAVSDTGTLSGVVNSDGITASFSSAGDAAAAPVGTGSYTISATLSDPNGKLSNYTVHQATANLTVSKAALYVTANDATKIQGEANPPFTVRYSGFVLGQDASVLGGLLTFSLTPTTGGYTITPSGLTSGNYAITFVSGMLTVLSYSQATSTLQAQVDAAGLDHGMQSSLDDQLQAALASFAAGDTADGVGQLGAFINHVRAQSGQHIDAALADGWIAYAQRIINAVG